MVHKTHAIFYPSRNDIAFRPAGMLYAELIENLPSKKPDIYRHPAALSWFLPLTGLSQVRFQDLASRGMTKTLQRLVFYLPHTLAGKVEFFAYFF